MSKVRNLTRITTEDFNVKTLDTLRRLRNITLKDANLVFVPTILDSNLKGLDKKDKSKVWTVAENLMRQGINNVLIMK